ncbi:MAG: chromosome segregation protein SMC [Propionibacteriaceae bacterium]|jgi:chromosome segregation protein|nr:chromosome segregation protein SMC [Propionibacteriaceae bacterium]
MYLKRLTLRGFKSFASTTTMVFEPGITAIVGPNGSGKSNVVDALAWVMGEQGPKHLRGASMEDVIFAGTSGRPALGRAEVVLTIDNTDQALPIDYSEVTLARTKFRNGASEYAINGTPCRLLDVRELLSDSGMGREMHVIVGQGQLDTILTATPETRRGLIEEAAGVLKHRERKDKAARKLEATESNLNRLTDLVAEIRRQLKPLGRQADVARRAGAIQAEARDARARLLADDLSQALADLAADEADEAEVTAQRTAAERRLAAVRDQEQTSERAAVQAEQAWSAAQETWYALSGLAEQVRSTITLANERRRRLELAPEPAAGSGRDPETLEAQADETVAAEQGLRAEIETSRQDLERAGQLRRQAEAAQAQAEAEHAARLLAEADRREGLARLGGRVAALSSRVESADEQVERLRQAVAQAGEREAAAQAERARLADGGGQIDDALAAAEQALAQAPAQAEAGQRAAAARESELRRAGESRAGLAARVEALRSALAPPDAAAALALPEAGLNGPAAERLRVEPGYEAAVSAALGPAVEAMAAPDLATALTAVARLKAGQLGRAGLLVAQSGDPADPDPNDSDPTGPDTAGDWRALADCLQVEPDWRPALTRLLRHQVVVDDLEQARAVVARAPELTAVTLDGDIVSAWLVVGGSAAQPSSLQVQAAIDQAGAQLTDAATQVTAGQQALAAARAERDRAAAQVVACRQTLDRARSAQAGARQRRSLADQAVRAAQDEGRRLGLQLEQVQAARQRDAAGLDDLRLRLEAAQAEPAPPVDPAERDRLAAAAQAARAVETEARLGLRTVEERARSLAGRAESLLQAAAAERAARAQAAAARQRLRAEAERADLVARGAAWLARRVEASLALAAAGRRQADQARRHTAAAVQRTRQEARALADRVEELVDSAHRDELARTQQRMRVAALEERASQELGLDAATLTRDYGPQVPVPLGGPPPDEASANGSGDQLLTCPYVRDEQLRRLRRAERDLQVLGRVNPLALEEFEALRERHDYLAAQLEDLRQTRQDLMEIIDDVDARVRQVFSQAYADVEREFQAVFARLFPGGQGRLFLTEPGQWLTTGVDVEARPAGKTVKRLSLLSGGERSLVAICFLIALFKARPSPFYILDEVEAALDDTNLSRLLGVYDELRHHSQLLVITHQKRTMEIADTLYGVTMPDDGITQVVSQRLRDGDA